MIFRRERCTNGCVSPIRGKILVKSDDNTWGYKAPSLSYCPKCGSLMPSSLKALKAFLKLYKLHPELKDAERLLYKSEFNSAAREAFVVVETSLRKLSGIDSHGKDLAIRALKIDKDKQTGTIIHPAIAVNDLKTESEINEQEGLQYRLMGFFQGERNIYQHRHVGSGASNDILVVLEASYFLYLFEGHSITKNGKWIKTKTSRKEIERNMPKLSDRLRYAIERRCWEKRRKDYILKQISSRIRS